MGRLAKATERLAAAMRPLPTSSYGYPVRNPTPSEQAFFALNPNVGGYAAEDRSIVLNEGARNDSGYLSNRELGAVAQNEAARLFMRDRGIVPEFNLTPEQQLFFQGTPYASNPESLKQSIAARIITGDQSAGKITKEQKDFSQRLLKQMRAKFDPEGDNYDYTTAIASGMGPTGENKGHWGSVAPTSPEMRKKYNLPEESYMVLKGKTHPTWDYAVKGEAERGFEIKKYGDRYFSVPKQ